MSSPAGYVIAMLRKIFLSYQGGPSAWHNANFMVMKIPCKGDHPDMTELIEKDLTLLVYLQGGVPEEFHTLAIEGIKIWGSKGDHYCAGPGMGLSRMMRRRCLRQKATSSRFSSS
ncbi:hypothetical protein BDK51DRAFT_31184 [Blyttiomyces helicus]|uniref:Uncharacterized protein n=1 Tax=Blyttiomyces helicus TaxID=388810 RepID=A0A4P9WH08_9FUNG|nr:hypothetical protein BDK51DRAFT_31184 [Blyttiomyces helicus]|eukprot:RKO91123.1 hypothetical protein BDK51DRAFT_31184 [Blyttiomyces helicus]